MNPIFKNKLDLFAPGELENIEKLDTPSKIQSFIDSNVEYDLNFKKYLSPLNVLRTGKAICLDAAVFAGFVLKFHGYDIQIVYLDPVRDESHALCVYKKNDKYGAIAQSKFVGLKGRPCIFNSVSDLVRDYIDSYFNFKGELTLRAYSQLIGIEEIDGWWYKDEAQLEISDKLDLCELKLLVQYDSERRYVTPEKFWAEFTTIPEDAEIGERYLEWKREHQV